MRINGLLIENTFAEAFNMKASRVIVTADNIKWEKTHVSHLQVLQHQ